MFTLLSIVTKLLLHPMKYELLNIPMTNGLVLVAFGERDKINAFDTLIKETHLRHLELEKSVVDNKSS